MERETEREEETERLRETDRGAARCSWQAGYVFKIFTPPTKRIPRRMG